MYRSRKATIQSSAFTLVELLVVIGISALLLALLLPAMSRARANAQKLQCASNLRTLGQLLMLHAADHRGYFPLAGAIDPGPTGLGSYSPQGLNDPTEQRYDYYSNGPTDYCVTALPAALAPYIINEPARADGWYNVDTDIQTPGPLRDAFLCPSDEDTLQRLYGAPVWISNLASSGYLSGWSSYGVNEEVFGWVDAGATASYNHYWTDTVSGHSRARGQISAVPNPSQTMLMCDTFQTMEVWVSGANQSLGDVYSESLPGYGNSGPLDSAGPGIFDLKRHRGRVNILFADGHVENMPILSTGETSPVGAAGSTGNSPSGAIKSVSMDRDFR